MKRGPTVLVESALRRFENKYIPEPMSGCWLWLGKAVNNCGYGFFGMLNSNILAHRAAWKLFRGEIPDGSLVLHKCDNKLCVNPYHLYLGDKRDNMRDAIERGQWTRYVKPHKLFCKRGHEKLALDHLGYRRCRTCHAELERTRRANRCQA